MRFGSTVRAALLALCVAAAGCATRSEPPVAKAAPVPAPTPATAPAQKVEIEPPISANVQRAYDEARRAMQAGRHDEAERSFRALAKSNPELGGPHANLGLLLRQAGKLAEAVAELELAVKANPKQPVYLNQLGITYRQLGEFQRARDAYERAVALAPDYAAAHLNLGILYDLYLWDGARALAAYDRYLALAPDEDGKVKKWIADLRNRKPPQQTLLSRKEQQ
jgi:tetratricopeptide (TPR) repeat protein